MYPDDSKIAKAAVDVIRETHGKLLTIGIGNLISRLGTDLWYGPVYVVESEEWPHQLYLSLFGEKGARQTDFGADCAELEEYLECLGTLWYDTQSGLWSSREPEGWWNNEDTGEAAYIEPADYDPEEGPWTYVDDREDWCEVDRRTILRAFLGAELAEHV